MRLATHIILAVVALMSLSGCTHNNGDIGYWFGQWHLDSIEVNGVPVPDYDGNTYFLFQGKVFCMRCVDEARHYYADSYAQWQESDDHQSVTLNFADDRYLPTINPLVQLETFTRLTVVMLTREKMVLEHTHSVTGAVITYYLTLLE